MKAGEIKCATHVLAQLTYEKSSHRRVGGAGEEETQHVFATLCRHLRLFSSFGAAVWSAVVSPLSQVMEKGKINFHPPSDQRAEEVGRPAKRQV